MDRELTHYGVLGMKWGVRRTDAQLARARKKTEGWSPEAKEAHEIKKKNPKQMTNTELKKLNERTRLEQEYSRLNPSSVAKGIKYVGAATAILGTAVGAYNNANTLIKIGKPIAEKAAGAALTSMVSSSVKRSLKKTKFNITIN